MRRRSRGRPANDPMHYPHFVAPRVCGPHPLRLLRSLLPLSLETASGLKRERGQALTSRPSIPSLAAGAFRKPPPACDRWRARSALPVAREGVDRAQLGTGEEAVVVAGAELDVRCG